MKSFFIAIAFFGLIGTLAPADLKQAKPDVEPILASHDASGHYRITGAGKEGRQYSGLVTLEKPDGAAIYIFRSLLGTDVYIGVGRMEGKKLNVAWKQGETIGLTTVSFNAKGDGRAEWVTLPGSGQARSESWVLLGGLYDE